MKFLNSYINEHILIAQKIDKKVLSKFVDILARVKKIKGRLFVIGVGGSAGNASHAVNDFRKLCGIEAYAPTDNVSELSARTNDEGWENVFESYLKINNLTNKDVILFFSVGGGSKEKKISVNLIKAANYAKKSGAKILSIIGREEGYLNKISHFCFVVPKVNASRITPHSETYQVFLWHMFVSHPKLQKTKTTW